MNSLQSFSSDELRQRARFLADQDTPDQWHAAGWKEHRDILAELFRREAAEKQAETVNDYQEGDDY